MQNAELVVPRGEEVDHVADERERRLSDGEDESDGIQIRVERLLAVDQDDVLLFVLDVEFALRRAERRLPSDEIPLCSAIARPGDADSLPEDVIEREDSRRSGPDTRDQVRAENASVLEDVDRAQAIHGSRPELEPHPEALRQRVPRIGSGPVHRDDRLVDRLVRILDGGIQGRGHAAQARLDGRVNPLMIGYRGEAMTLLAHVRSPPR